MQKKVMELQEVKEMLKSLSLRHGDIFDIEVSINGRLTRTLGRVMLSGTKSNCKPSSMEFSRQMLETVAREDIESVVQHEWAHYYITKMTGVDHGHDKMFKELCANIGCHGTISIKVERTIEVKSKSKSKYSVYCADCGKLVAEYSRKCKTTNNPEMYHSKCCNAQLRVVQNY